VKLTGDDMQFFDFNGNPVTKKIDINRMEYLKQLRNQDIRISC